MLQEEFKHLRPLSARAYTSTDSNYRRCKMISLTGVLTEYQAFRELDIKKQDDIIHGIEESVYNKALKKAEENSIFKSWNAKFMNLYSADMLEIIQAIDGNPKLIESLINQTIKPSDVADLEYKVLFPKVESQVEIANQRRNQTITTKTTMLYQCPQCGRKEANFQEVQVRSGDEGKDLQLVCIFCGNEWFERG